jgi:hypothetical protein
MKVRFIKSPSGSPHLLGYFQGDVAELNDVVAKKLIVAGIAEQLTQTVVVEEEKPKIENTSSTKPKKAIKR